MQNHFREIRIISFFQPVSLCHRIFIKGSELGDEQERVTQIYPWQIMKYLHKSKKSTCVF